MCPQGREIFTQLSVEENLRVGLLSRGDGLREIPEFIFEIFPVLKQMLSRRGGDLSGGQQQQLAIGRALILNPKLLILDEPTEGIQPNIVHENRGYHHTPQSGKGIDHFNSGAKSCHLLAGSHNSFAFWIKAET